MAGIGEGELYRGLGQAMNKYGRNGVFGPSFYDQYRNYNLGLDYLDGLNQQGRFADNQGLYDKALGQLNAGKTSAAIGGGLAVANGLLGIGQAAANNVKIADTTPYSSQYGLLDTIAADGYSNADQINEDFAQINRLSRKNYNFDTINGKTTGQKLANVGSAALAGANAGSVFGPWGILGGALVGTLAGAGSWAWGDYKAKAEENALDEIGDYEAEEAARRAARSYDAWNDNEFNFKYAHSVANGGGIRRKEQTIKDFANRVLKNSRSGEPYPPARLVRTHCKGGTLVKIRVK